MSRGFVKEDDQEEAPFIPPRAALPQGTINYVTPQGYNDLVQEREILEGKLGNLEIEDDKEKRHARATLTGKLNLLNDRISSSRILEPGDQPKDEVRFGAIVSFKFLSGKQKDAVKKFQLVGVDEANVKLKKIAFVAPIAQAITGKKIGEIAKAPIGGEMQELQILSLKYPD